MPQIKNGPKSLNSLLESVYASCMKKRNNKTICSMSAWSAAKNAGWRHNKDGRWIRKDTVENFEEILKHFEKREIAITQSVLLSKEVFETKEKAVSWLKGHNKKFGKIDETDDYWRARQRDPADFDPKTFRTHEIDEGIKLILGRLKK